MKTPIRVEYLDDLEDLEERLLKEGELLVELPLYEEPVRLEVWVAGVKTPVFYAFLDPYEGAGETPLQALEAMEAEMAIHPGLRLERHPLPPRPGGEGAPGGGAEA